MTAYADEVLANVQQHLRSGGRPRDLTRFGVARVLFAPPDNPAHWLFLLASDLPTMLGIAVCGFTLERSAGQWVFVEWLTDTHRSKHDEPR